MDISLVSLAYVALDKQYILRSRKESFGYSCLTNQRQYYPENNPGLTIEKWEEDYLDAARVSTKISKLLDIRHLMDYIRFYLNRKRGRVC